VAHVPWARQGAGHTLAFDQTVAWLVTQCSKTAVTQLLRIAWRTVGAVIARVWADVEALGDRLEGLSRIGIDEISYKRGHRFLTVVVDHDTGRLLWAAPGGDRATLRGFFGLLGAELPVLIDRPVEVGPPPSDLHVRLVDKPPIAASVPGRAGGVDELSREGLHPAVDRDVIDFDAALSQQLLDVAVRQALAQLPTHGEPDHLVREAVTRGRRP
jgi:hypothetical protein